MKKGLRKCYANGGVLDQFDSLAKAAKDQMPQSGGTAGFIPDQMAITPEQRTGVPDFAARGQGLMRDISSNSGLSQRQKANQYLAVGDSLAKAGLSAPTPQIGTGLSARQGMNYQLGALDNGIDALAKRPTTAFADGGEVGSQPRPATSFFKGVRQMQDPARRDKMVGYKNGGLPGVDKKGFIDGPGGVDNVPAKVAETGEDILVSKGERIVNKPQNEALEELVEKTTGKDMDDFLEGATGKPVGASVKNGMRSHNKGGYIDDFGTFNDPGVPPQGGSNNVLKTQRAYANAPLPEATGQPRMTNVGGSMYKAGSAEAAAAQSAADTAASRANALRTGLKMAGRVAGGAAALGAVNDMANSDDPADQLSAGIKGGLSAYPATAPLGAALAAADSGVKTLTGHNLAEGIDRLAQLHPDYMRNTPYSSVASDTAPGGRSYDPLAAAKAAHAEIMAGDNVGKIDGLATPEEKRGIMAGNANRQAAAQLEVENRDPDVATLRAAGVRGPVLGDVPDNAKDALGRSFQRTGNTGIRTIDTKNGNVYAGRDASGQLQVSSGEGRSAADNEAMRATEAKRMTDDMARQTAAFAALKQDNLLHSNDPRDQAVGEFEGRMGLARKQIEADTSFKNAELGIRAQEAGLRRDQMTMQFQKDMRDSADKRDADFQKDVTNNQYFKPDGTPDAAKNSDLLNFMRSAPTSFYKKHGIASYDDLVGSNKMTNSARQAVVADLRRAYETASRVKEQQKNEWFPKSGVADGPTELVGEPRKARISDGLDMGFTNVARARALPVTNPDVVTVKDRTGKTVTMRAVDYIGDPADPGSAERRAEVYGLRSK